MPALMNLVGADSVLWTELGQTAGRVPGGRPG